MINKKLFRNLILSVFIISTPAFSETPSAESIKILMQRTGAAKLGHQMMSQMMPSMKKMIPNAPEKFWKDIMTEINSDKIIDLLIPIYQKHLTQSDIKAMNAFYDTPTGKKLMKVQPAIVQESMLVGQQWGQELAQKIMARYQEQAKNNK